MVYNDLGVQTYQSAINFYPNAGPAPKPNISDPDIPATNEARLLTPNIDTLAEDGLRMTSFHTARLCSPSRAKLLTGRYASRMDLDRVFNPSKTTGFSTREVTLPEKLRELGYATGMVGKWHLGYNPTQAQPLQMMPTRNGFQEFYGVPHSNDMDDYHLIRNETIIQADMGEGETYQTQLTWKFTEAALDFIERTTAKDQPFFLYFAHAMTHEPCWPSNQEFTNADGSTWPMFKGSSGVSHYYDVVKEVDHSVGRVLSKLEDLGIAEDTMVIFTSDNGPWLTLATLNLQEHSVGSAYPLKDGKFSTWEGGCRVPFLVRWPGQIAAAAVTDQVGGLEDFLPTLLPLAGGSVPVDRTIDGIDLWPVWSGQTNELDRMYALFYDGTAEGVIKGNWKLRNGQLYDLDSDIQEETDLSANAAYTALLAELTVFKSSIENSAATDVEPLGTFTSYEVELSANDLQVSEGGTATVDVRLSHNPGGSVAVNVGYFSGDVDLSVSAGSSLSFTTSNWSSWQTVTLAAAPDGDAAPGGATFRVTTSAHDAVRELFVFEVDDEAAPAASASLLWPKVESVNAGNQTVKLIAEGRAQVGAEIDPSGTLYSWKKVSGPGAVTFTDAATHRTGVSFSTNGTYQRRFVGGHKNAAAFGAVDFTANVGVAGAAAVGAYKYAPTLAYDATTDDDGDAYWDNEVASGIRDWAFQGSVVQTATNPAPTLSFIDAAWVFSGGTIPGSDSAISSTYDEYSNADASIEIWFKPDTLPLSSPQVLWETGGDTGASITLDGNLIRFAVDESSGAVAEGTISPSAAQDGFVHCVGVIDLANSQIELYLDGSAVDTQSIATVTDWSALSQAGLGTIVNTPGVEVADTNHLGGNDQLSGTFAAFAGQIAHMLFYENALTALEIADLATGPREAPMSGSVNFAPVVSAGIDQSIDYTLGVVLAGSASDDGLPTNSNLNTLWRKTEGPGSADIANNSQLSTTGDFDLPGTYQLWLEADDGEVKVYDDVDIAIDLLSFAEWAAEVGLSGGQDGVEDNPDGDSYFNYWEWVLGLDPEAFDAPMSLGDVVASGTSNTVNITFTFDVPRNRTPDLGLETSEDLLNSWTIASNLVPQIDVLNAGTNRWTFELEVDTDAIPELFARPVGDLNGL
jgi:arylsulfatase A-like enzyme